MLALCQHLAPHVDVTVATTDADGQGAVDMPIGREVEVRGVRVRYFRRWPRISFAPSAALVAFLKREIRSFDVVHVTAAFAFPSTAGCRLAQRAGVPYVASPRGSCRVWALGHKRIKKAPYWALVERSNLSRAAAIHATSDEERNDLLRLVPRARVEVIPNGVELPGGASPEPRAPARVVFLGRLHPVKALDQLLPALSLVTKEVPELEAVLAGPDDVGEWARLERLREQLSPKPRISYIGSVSGPAKDALLACATVLALPSHTENFGQVVVEALAQGTPVVASSHTPWRVLEERGAGRWVSNEPERFAAALLDVLQSPDESAARSTAARALAAEYSWDSVARRMAALYASVGARA